MIYGSPEVTSGGNALKFFSSIRLDTRRKELLPDNVGIRCKVKVVKNKVSTPFQSVMLDIMFGKGIDHLGCLVDAAVEKNIVIRKGSWYSYNDENFAQGRAKACEYLSQHENLDVKNEIEQKTRQTLIQDIVDGNIVDTEDDLNFVVENEGIKRNIDLGIDDEIGVLE